MDVAGVEDAEVWVVEADADGAREVACVEEFAIDAGFAEFEAAAGALVAPAAETVVDFAVGEERVFSDAVLIALGGHDVAAVVEHGFGDFRGERSHDGASFRLATHEDWERADVVEVGVGDDDRVEEGLAEEGEIGKGVEAFSFRVHA